MKPTKNEYFGVANEPTENAKNKWQMSRLLPVFLGSLPEVVDAGCSHPKMPVVSQMQHVSPG